MDSYNFLYFKQDKIDVTDYSKIKREKREKKVVKRKLSLDERLVIDYLQKELRNNNYIIANNVHIDKLSKAKVKKILSDEKLLKDYKIKRVRATKKLKEKRNIKINSYPYIIIN